MDKAVYLLFILLLFSCKDKTQDNYTKEEKCNGYYANKYAKFFNEWSVNREDKKVIDSTLYYLDKKINCDVKNTNNIQEKANFLIYNGFYDEAIIEIDSISNTEPFFKMMKGALALRLGRNNSENLLKEAHNGFTQNIQKHHDPNDVFWKIMLDNYFEGKEYALKHSAKAKKNFNEEYQITNIEAVEQMIKEISKKEVLYHVFKIK